jgi:hypothetical protein
MTDWDGTSERRAPLILAAELQPKETVNAPVIMVLIGFAAMLLLQAAAVWSHGTLLQNQRHLIDQQQQFVCYVVRSTQGETGTGILTECGFLNLGTK